MNKNSVIKTILEAGIAAPSGNNIQPWKFKVTDKKIELYLDEIDNSFFNFKNITSLISCGAVIENMMRMAYFLHMDPYLEMFPNPKCIASIEILGQNEDFDGLVTMLQDHGPRQ